MHCTFINKVYVQATSQALSCPERAVYSPLREEGLQEQRASLVLSITVNNSFYPSGSSQSKAAMQLSAQKSPHVASH